MGLAGVCGGHKTITEKKAWTIELKLDVLSFLHFCFIGAAESFPSGGGKQ